MDGEPTEVTTLIPKNKKKKQVLLTVAIVLAIILIIIIVVVLIWYFLSHKSSGSGSNAFPLPKGFSVDSLKDPEERLKALLKLKSTLDRNESAVSYSVGFVFLRDMLYPTLFGSLRPLFFYERISASGTEKVSEGSFVILSNEFGVYRNITDGSILSSWYNQITYNMTEVFPLERGPWDFMYDTKSDVLNLPYLVQPDGTIAMVTEDINQYKSHIDPDRYPDYDFVGHPYYQDAEFTRFYGNLSDLTDDSQMASYPTTGTWSRRGQYLPWMQLGNYSGGLMYIGPLWKVDNLTDIPSDIVQYAQDSNFTRFLQKPSTFEEPNQNSWDYFNEVIEERNASGDPLIQIPPENKTSHYNNFDIRYNRALDGIMLGMKNETVFLKGRVYSAKQSTKDYGKYLGQVIGYGMIHNITQKPSTLPPLFYLSLSVAMSWEKAKSGGGSNEVIHQASQRGCFHFGGEGTSHLKMPQWLTRTVGSTLFVTSSADGLDSLGDSANTLSLQFEGIPSLAEGETPNFQGSLVRVENIPAWISPDSNKDIYEEETMQMMSHIEFVRLKGNSSTIVQPINCNIGSNKVFSFPDTWVNFNIKF